MYYFRYVTLYISGVEEEMKWQLVEDIPYQTTLTVTINELDLVQSQILKSIRNWYETQKDHKISDELFYLSEIAKGLGL